MLNATLNLLAMALALVLPTFALVYAMVRLLTSKWRSLAIVLGTLAVPVIAVSYLFATVGGAAGYTGVTGLAVLCAYATLALPASLLVSLLAMRIASKPSA
ncbi:hypothetical protein [Novosphingobium sp. 9]|uniref:hypothetical protein n=1 Tax=Novosphingobium sp. 9 TaxID=2025349 RepID=UPI0021B5350A|nr:hypothetical protein [Novosphingobium sp. 9]